MLTLLWGAISSCSVLGGMTLPASVVGAARAGGSTLASSGCPRGCMHFQRRAGQGELPQGSAVLAAKHPARVFPAGEGCCSQLGLEPGRGWRTTIMEISPPGP